MRPFLLAALALAVGCTTAARLNTEKALKELFAKTLEAEQIAQLGETQGVDCGISDLGMLVVALPPLGCPDLADIDREAKWTAEHTKMSTDDLLGTTVTFYPHAMLCDMTYAVGCTWDHTVVLKPSTGYTNLRHELLHVMLQAHGISGHPCFLFNRVDPENMACKEEREREFPLKPRFAGWD